MSAAKQPAQGQEKRKEKKGKKHECKGVTIGLLQLRPVRPQEGTKLLLRKKWQVAGEGLGNQSHRGAPLETCLQQSHCCPGAVHSWRKCNLTSTRSRGLQVGVKRLCSVSMKKNKVNFQRTGSVINRLLALPYSTGETRQTHQHLSTAN